MLILGLLGLWIGTESSVHGALAIAQRLGISEFIVGVTILSIGSDFPEFAIAVDGALNAENTAEVSNVIIGSALGSALCQISFVLGVAGLFSYLTLPRRITIQHGSILLGAIIFLALFACDGHISRTEGIALIIVYVVYLVFLFSERKNYSAISTEQVKNSMPKSLAFLVVGLVCLFASAKLTIASVLQVANLLGVESSIIAVIVVGLGTSLPEFSISLGAVLKGKSRLSVGNLIGSNIFDTLVPVGVAASIRELDFETSFLVRELPILFMLSLLVLFFFVREKGIQKKEAVVIVTLYVTYISYNIIIL